MRVIGLAIAETGTRRLSDSVAGWPSDGNGGRFSERDAMVKRRVYSMQTYVKKAGKL